MSEAGAHELEAMREQLDEALRMLKAERATRVKLEAQVAWLVKQLMGKKSERRTDANTGDLFDFDEVAADAASEPDTADEEPDDPTPPPPSRNKRKVGGRRKLPEDLPRRTTKILPPDEECHCVSCDLAKTEIGREVSERLEYQPGSLLVLREERVKLACPGCHEGVACAPLPPRPIERGLPGPGLLAFVLTSKYAEHSTLYRLESILERHGLSVARSTMCGWIAAAAMLLEPIVKEMRRELVAGKYVQADETPVRLLKSAEKSGSSKSWLWLYRWGDGLVLYDFKRSRSGDGPKLFLEGFEGHLQVDGYGGYDVIFKSKRVVRVACWAHARRKFIDAEATDPDLAIEMVGMIRVLYRIEKLAREKGLSPDERLALRRERSVPMLKSIEEWLLAKEREVLPSCALGEAIKYAVNRWAALQVYTTDGHLEIDNNSAERAIRPVAIGRRNWLFFAGEAGGERAATIFSLVTSCKELGVDPFAYLRDVLNLVSTTPQSRIHELTPRGWKAAREDVDAAVEIAATASS